VGGHLQKGRMGWGFFCPKSKSRNGWLQEGRETVIPYLIKIFHACLSTGYVPAIWRQVKVAFILTHNRNSCSRPRDFRTISLSWFLLKTTERLLDRYLRDEALVQVPLHPSQHAYQVGKSVEMALHQLVVRLTSKKEPWVFSDIEGAFNNTCYETKCDALVRHGAITLMYSGLGPPWRVTWLW
jgi:hypothetical protein